MGYLTASVEGPLEEATAVCKLANLLWQAFLAGDAGNSAWSMQSDGASVSLQLLPYRVILHYRNEAVVCMVEEPDPVIAVKKRSVLREAHTSYEDVGIWLSRAWTYLHQPGRLNPRA